MSDAAIPASDAPYVEQLARGHPLLSFEPALEAAFREHYRRSSRLRVRTGLIATAVLTLLSLPLTHFVFRPPAEVLASFDAAIGVLVVFLAVALLASVWDREMRVLPRALMVGALFASAALGVLRVEFERRGLHYPFALENYVAILIFLLSGWRWFVALAIGLSALTVMLSLDLALGAPLAATAEHGFNLLATGTFSAAACYLAEHISRTQFLHHHIIRFRAAHDGLTQLLNRRSFDEQFARTWREARREGKRVAVMLADVDHFKQFNDAYGHTQGDAALQAIAQVLRGHAGRRPLDLAARLGGEEFCAVWYDVDEASAHTLAEGFRTAIERCALPHRAAPAGVVTVSCGVELLAPRGGDEPARPLEAADAALYAAKRAGRNRVCGGLMTPCPT
jgi:diguanylate cyclase (GGDEF)-like protein